MTVEEKKERNRKYGAILPGDGLRVLCTEIRGKRSIKHQGGSSRPVSAVSSVGKSTRLITGRAWVRVPHGALVARTATLQQR